MKKLNLFLLMLATLLALTSFSGNDKLLKCIPPDFDPGKTILLIEFKMHDIPPNDPYSYDKTNMEMREYVHKKYPYKFEIVYGFVDGNKKYADKDKYRYVLKCIVYGDSLIYQVATSEGPDYQGDPPSRKAIVRYRKSPRSRITYDWHIWDRKLDIHYKVTSRVNKFPLKKGIQQMINTIVKSLGEKN